jgi:hypothetical protein
VNVSPQLRAVLIAGGLALTALALGFVTLSMNQSSSSAAPKKILSLKARGLASAHAAPAHATPTAKPKPKPKPKPADVHRLAALRAGLPGSVATQLGGHATVVVELFSKSDPVDVEARDEAKAGAALAGAGFLAVDVDVESGTVSDLTRAVGALPPAPASLVYSRPAALFVTLTGFNDRTTVAQAAANAGDGATAPAATTTAPAATPPSAAASPPATLAG